MANWRVATGERQFYQDGSIHLFGSLGSRSWLVRERERSTYNPGISPGSSARSCGLRVRRFRWAGVLAAAIIAFQMFGLIAMIKRGGSPQELSAKAPRPLVVAQHSNTPAPARTTTRAVPESRAPLPAARLPTRHSRRFGRRDPGSRKWRHHWELRCGRVLRGSWPAPGLRGKAGVKLGRARRDGVGCDLRSAS